MWARRILWRGGDMSTCTKGVDGDGMLTLHEANVSPDIRKREVRRAVCDGRGGMWEAAQLQFLVETESYEDNC